MRKASFTNQSDVNHLSFNQDFTCVAVGTRNGFSVYNLEPIELRFNRRGEGIGCIEMLYCTSLLALVGSGDQAGSSPRKFKLWNTQSQETICEITFASTVLNAVLNRERLIVCLESQIHVYDLASMKCLQVLSTAPNPKGLAALSTESSSYLVFPSGTGGSVVLYDCITLRLLSQIDAHKTAVAALQFNNAGTVLATASSTGTVIRLFSVPNGTHLCTFRRGSRPSSICSLSFSSDSAVLAVGSSTGTVHLFDVESALRRLVMHASSQPPPAPSVGSAGARGGERAVRSGSGGGESHSGAAPAPPPVDGSGATWTASAMSYLSYAQSWGAAAVGGIGQAVLPEPVQEYAESIRAVALARLPPSTVQTGSGGFIAGVVSASGGRARSSGGGGSSSSGGGDGGEKREEEQEEEEESFKIVVVTQKRQLFRYAVPKNMCELTDMQRKRDADAVAVECTLEDEALLD